MHSILKSEQEPQQTPHTETIRCPYCGIDRNYRGKMFNRSSLRLHISKSHASEMEAEVKPDNALTCGICGTWKSLNGRPFFSELDLSRHRSAAHRDSSMDSSHAPQASNDTPKQVRIKDSKNTAKMPVNFCPQCGCNVEVVAAALSFLL